jgi:drug/metabolite transporter (DMT)-like permease
MKQQRNDHNINIKKNKSLIIVLALISVYLFWGGTYLGMKFAIETMPPFLMAGIRFSVAGWILYIAYRIKGEKQPTFEEWKNAGIVGTLLLLGGNGVVAWAEQQVPSSIASVLIATVPLWIISFGYLGGAKKPSIGSIVGIIFGLCGIGILVWNSSKISSQAANIGGILALIFASISWSAGSIYSRKAKLPSAPLLSTGVQMIVGGILLIIAAAFRGEYRGFRITQISNNSWIALGYLIVFGSLVAYSAYIWLLKNAEPSVVSTYAFVNPFVAVFLGWLLAGEKIGANALVAAIFIIVAVIIITLFRDKGNLKEGKDIMKATETTNQVLLDIATTIENVAKNIKNGKISILVEDGKIVKVATDDPQKNSLVYGNGDYI